MKYILYDPIFEEPVTMGFKKSSLMNDAIKNLKTKEEL